MKFHFRHVFEYLNQKLKQIAKQQNLLSVHYLTSDFHVWPDLHGNRSPLADSTIKGMICGLTMSSTVENLAITYIGFVQALSVCFRAYFICKICSKLIMTSVICSMELGTFWIN